MDTPDTVRCVAPPDSLKSERICRDLTILINTAAERPTATTLATLHPLSVSDAEEHSLKPREALERRKCRPLTTRAEHALRVEGELAHSGGPLFWMDQSAKVPRRLCPGKKPGKLTFCEGSLRLPADRNV